MVRYLISIVKEINQEKIIDIILENVASKTQLHVLRVQEESDISQFLINLRPEFELVHDALMKKETPPDLDTCPTST